MKRCCLFFCLLVVATAPVSAYIDPMSGSTILYVAAGFFAALFYGLRGFFYRLVNLWKGRGFSPLSSNDDHAMVFYSEGRQYWNVFLPIIEALEKKKIKTLYLTSSNDDPGLQYQSDYLDTRYLGTMVQSWVALNHLRANLVVMTTPQLDIMTLRRSRHVKHYAHVLHSPTDIHSYRKFAFDYFDSVLCSGPYQIESIREMEKHRKSHKKLLLETGLTYYDVLARQLQNSMAIENQRPVVLVAPTWQPFSIMNRFGEELIDRLLSIDKYQVILRPHPQSYVSFPEIIASLEQRFQGREYFDIDRRASGAQSLQQADLMISDISGAVFDIAFLRQKPVLFFDVPFSGKGMEAANLEHPAWDMDIRSSLGLLCKEDDLQRLEQHIDAILAKPSDDLLQIKDQSLFNFGRAGEKAAEQLLNILQEIET